MDISIVSFYYVFVCLMIGLFGLSTLSEEEKKKIIDDSNQEMKNKN